MRKSVLVLCVIAAVSGFAETFTIERDGRAAEGVPTNEIARAVAEDVANEVRPGGVAQPGFWNENATRFMYPASIRFLAVPGAAQYRFTVVDPDGKVSTFDATDPVARLKACWTNLAAGVVNVVCEPRDAKGVRVGLVQDRFFYKKPPFTGGGIRRLRKITGPRRRRPTAICWRCRRSAISPRRASRTAVTGSTAMRRR